MIFWKLILVFLKIGIFGFGGGYAMLSLIQDEVVSKHQWMSNEEFANLVTVSQTTPGPIGINTATYVGYSAVTQAGYSSAYGILGAALATISVNLPAFLLIVLLSYSLKRFRKHPVFEAVMKVLRPLGMALILYAAYILSPENMFQNWISIAIFIFSLILLQRFKLHPVLLIVVVALVGVLVY